MKSIKTKISAILLVMFLVLFVIGSTPGTNKKWLTLRAMSSTDETGLAANGAYYSALNGVKPLKEINPRDNIGGLQIIFKLTDAENETANWVLYACKGVGSPAQCVAYGTCTAGSTQTGTANEYYADTITITNEARYTDVEAQQGLQYNLGTGVVTGAGIAFLRTDSCEYTHWLMLMSKGTCATMGALFSNYY